MYKFGEDHPILFEIILIVAAFLAAAVFVVAGSILYLPSEFSTSVGRILVGLILLILYRRAFKAGNPFRNFVILLPAFLFAIWNLFYNLSSGMEIGGTTFFIEGLLTALAPALFEEVIFRGIFIYNLQKKGNGDLACLLISSLVFSLIHATNIVGMDLVSVLLQVGYSFVVGMVLAAIYLKNGSIFQVILAHFLTDYTNHIFVSQASSASALHLVIFGLLLAAEAVYALVLTVGMRKN